jgi:hypothetical protein
VLPECLHEAKNCGRLNEVNYFVNDDGVIGVRCRIGIGIRGAFSSLAAMENKTVGRVGMLRIVESEVF